jgi:hypothetical protein
MQTIKKLIILGIIFLSTLPVTSAQAAMVWEEDFSGDLDDWDVSSYEYSNWNTVPAEKIIDTGLSIENGALVGQMTGDFKLGGFEGGNWSLATHESNVAFGSWNLDLFMEKGWLNVVDLEIAFMFNDPVFKYDWIGETNHDLIRKSSGYILWIHNFASYSTREPYSDDTIKMVLVKHQTGDSDRVDLGVATFEIDFSKVHEITFNKSIDHQIQVMFDDEIKLNITETESYAITSSETFAFFHWNGRLKLDNITVSAFSPSGATNGFLIIVAGLTLLMLVIVRINRRKG